MKKRAGLNQVKFKVRRNSLLLRSFTVADIIRATGLNPESVRTEIQRMKKEGLLITQSTREKNKKRGSPPKIYHLTNNSKARLALSESVEAYYSPLPVTNHPTSHYFTIAQRLLDKAQDIDDQQRNKILDEAELSLEMAKQAEGSSMASDEVKAYIEYEYVRLAYLRGDRKKAQQIVLYLQEFFTGKTDETILNRLYEYHICLEAYDRFEKAMTKSVGESILVRCLLESLSTHEFRTDSPLVSVLIQLLRNLSETADEKIRAAAFDLTLGANPLDIRPEMVDVLSDENTGLTFKQAIYKYKELLQYANWLRIDETQSIPVDNWPRPSNLPSNVLRKRRLPEND